MLQRELIFNSLMVAIIILQSVDCVSEEDIPELVNRRPSGDIYFSYSSGSFFTCAEGNTYLVDERQCVSQQQLLNGMGLGL